MQQQVYCCQSVPILRKSIPIWAFNSQPPACGVITHKSLIRVLFRNTLRKTQSAALASTEEGGENSIYLGVKGKDFKFQQLSKLKVGAKYLVQRIETSGF